ncbi:hypothetical protein [Leptolyngbya sp. FACHB-17]|uniref:hypothetical protein n=1 Tax=unclassified Leptolyngbya TaxID=2650499 RepID=UPI00198CB29E|nr:hypothetical protein [Leptolyngbya sp. FACHB-17]MBD2080752.1 hypothetical protein [Leptolyngbya sp. FACHB-17]
MDSYGSHCTKPACQSGQFRKPQTKFLVDFIHNDVAGVWQSQLHEPEPLQPFERADLPPTVQTGLRVFSIQSGVDCLDKSSRRGNGRGDGLFVCD